MIEFVEGDVVEISPTHIVINTNGVGYFLHISLYAYEKMQQQKKLRVLTHLSVKEDSHTLFGFFNHTEREIFRHLINVSGIGPATARVILSSLNQQEIISAILSGNVALLRSIKGIGPKAAQRLILELQDKMGKIEGHSSGEMQVSTGRSQEAIDALLALGFARAATEKVVARCLAEAGGEMTTEELIKKSLRLL
ncbi:MAG: Holliday junction branch migration protein RuvA [Bacteroidetes bacterium]|nr:Holliday junction branch migration protein RuvA [Bacteroidota bacterium]